MVHHPLPERAHLGQLVVNLCTNANEALDGADGPATISVGQADLDHPDLQLLSASKVTSPERYTVMRTLEGTDRILIGHVALAVRYAFCNKSF